VGLKAYPISIAFLKSLQVKRHQPLEDALLQIDIV
jgi:hypothetical protein